MQDDSTSNLIATAIEKSELQWRTVRGLAKQLVLKETVVAQALENSSLFLRARQPNKPGDALYTTVRKYKRNVPWFERALNAAANTVNS